MKPGDPEADLAYLQHIRDAAETIAAYLKDIDEATFKATRLVQDGVIRRLQIIGEATKKLSPRLRREYPAVPWQDIAGMRDKLVHDYFGVDLDAVWLAATGDVPDLLRHVLNMLPKD
jgi:uncharacterized protein with HEPN domain